MKKRLYFFKDLYSSEYSHLDLYQYSEDTIKEQVFAELVRVNRELKLLDLKGDKIAFLTQYLKDIREKIENKYSQDSGGECDFSSLKNCINYNLEFENEKLVINQDTLTWFFVLFTHKYGVIVQYSQYDTLIGRKNDFENIAAESFDFELIESLFIDLEISFEVIELFLVYQYFLGYYNHYFDYDSIYSIEGIETDIKVTRQVIILNELGILDNLKEKYKDWREVSREVDRLLGLSQGKTQTAVNSIKNNSQSNKNPYNAKQEALKYYIQQVQSLLGKS